MEKIRIEQLWELVQRLVRDGSAWRAKETLQTIITISPSHAMARAELSHILNSEGDFDAALLQAHFAFSLNPSIPGLEQRLADLLFLSAIYDRALSHYEHSLRQGANDRQIVERVAICRQILAQQTEEREEDIN